MGIRNAAMTTITSVSSSEGSSRPRTIPATRKPWTEKEDENLRQAINEIGPRKWKQISLHYFGGERSSVQCLHRWHKVLRPGLIKGPWSPEEDEIIRECIRKGITKWSEVSTRIPGRLSKQCRERWYNHLDPSIKKGNWTKKEDQIIVEAQKTLGNRWSSIARLLPGRSENAVKNRWNYHLHRRARNRPKGGSSSSRRRITRPGCKGSLLSAASADKYPMPAASSTPSSHRATSLLRPLNFSGSSLDVLTDLSSQYFRGAAVAPSHPKPDFQMFGGKQQRSQFESGTSHRAGEEYGLVTWPPPHQGHPHLGEHGSSNLHQEGTWLPTVFPSASSSMAAYSSMMDGRQDVAEDNNSSGGGSSSSSRSNNNNNSNNGCLVPLHSAGCLPQVEPRDEELVQAAGASPVIYPGSSRSMLVHDFAGPDLWSSSSVAREGEADPDESMDCSSSSSQSCTSSSASSSSSSSVSSSGSSASSFATRGEEGHVRHSPWGEHGGYGCGAFDASTAAMASTSHAHTQASNLLSHYSGCGSDKAGLGWMMSPSSQSSSLSAAFSSSTSVTSPSLCSLKAPSSGAERHASSSGYTFSIPPSVASSFQHGQNQESQAAARSLSGSGGATSPSAMKKGDPDFLWQCARQILEDYSDSLDCYVKAAEAESHEHSSRSSIPSDEASSALHDVTPSSATTSSSTLHSSSESLHSAHIAILPPLSDEHSAHSHVIPLQLGSWDHAGGKTADLGGHSDNRHNLAFHAAEGDVTSSRWE